MAINGGDLNSPAAVFPFTWAIAVLLATRIVIFPRLAIIAITSAANFSNSKAIRIMSRESIEPARLSAAFADLMSHLVDLYNSTTL
jgi:hypothetical protein